MEHLNLNIIQSYSEGQITGSESTEIEGHLATCQRCHGTYMGLKMIENTMSRSFKEEKATASCPEDWEIASLIMEEAPSDISEKISKHIKECGFCIERAAVYYKALELEKEPIKTPESWKKMAFQTLRSESKDQEEKRSILQKISAFFHKISSLLPPLPGYAIAALVIAFLIWNGIPDKGNVVTIASSEKLIIRDSEIPSTFGFMGSGEERIVNNMEIKLKKDRVVFKWKPVEDASEYSFSIAEKTKGNIVFSQSVFKKPQTSLEDKIIEKQRLYAWIIKGKSPDGRYFEYTGDFILVK